MRARLISVLKVSPSNDDADVLAADQRGWRNRSRSSSRSRDRAAAPPMSRRRATRDRLQHLDGAARRVLLDDAGAFDQEDEGRRAAVHDRHFRPVELDDRVVDLAAGEAPPSDARSSRSRCPRRSTGSGAQRGIDRIAPDRRDLGAGAADRCGGRRCRCPAAPDAGSSRSARRNASPTPRQWICAFERPLQHDIHVVHLALAVAPDDVRPLR